MKDEHNLDELFKKGLEEIDIPFREEDWMEMSKKLDQQEKKTIFPLWLTLFSAAAASVLIFFIFFNTPEKDHSAKRVEKKHPDRVVPNQQPTSEIKEQVEEKQKAAGPSPVIQGQQELADVTVPPVKSLQPVSLPRITENAENNIVAMMASKLDTLQTAGLSRSQSKPSVKELQRNNPSERLSFTLIAAPDISSTSSSVTNKVSTNVGLMVNYALTKKIGISTGVIYAKKLYDYNGYGGSVPGYGSSEWRVDADCKVLDVPINIDYQVFKKRTMAFNVSAGLSSYLMLNEKYQLTTGPAQRITNEEVTGNKHFLGVANFSVSVERQVSSRLSLGLQPFLKIPLTGIGKYEGNLSSAGVSVLFHIKSLSRNN